MSCSAEKPQDSRIWNDADGRHLDVRGLECPNPMVEILGLIDRGEAGDVLIVHLDQEPLFLYSELDDRGWAHELMAEGCGAADCTEGYRLRLVRMSA
ncbi:MAG TPA: DUF2249 domain-containing protein [Steroidobacteraceae bacterium]